MENHVTFRRGNGLWRLEPFLLDVYYFAFLLSLACSSVKTSESGKRDADSIPCPPQVGGLLTSGDPESPGPFHDITIAEFDRLYPFLKSNPELNLASPDNAAVNTSSIYVVDLLVATKQQVLDFLDGKAQQPSREARVMIFRGDKSPPVVEEYRVGPLDQPAYAELIVSTQRKNPAPFSVRPVGDIEMRAIYEVIVPKVNQLVGHILLESYGGTLINCGDTCFKMNISPVGSNLSGNIHERKIWFTITYPPEYYSLHELDFGFRVSVAGSDPGQWTVDKVFYSGVMYDSLEELNEKYHNDSSTPKTCTEYVHPNKNLSSTQNLRGDPVPENPMRPPVQLEPDGKRYTITHRHINYLHWDLDLRLSSLNGPHIYDVRFKGERIAYEMGLSEIAVFYSANSPMQKVTNYIDSGFLIGVHSKSLVPGVDCPEGATFLNMSFFGELTDKAKTYPLATCVFEHNTGVPLRRHLAYVRSEGGFFAGMPDSVLTVRFAMALDNYDYILDFVFHQSGAIEVKAISTGYIFTVFYSTAEDPYGFRLNEQILGNIHHHTFHFKADLDIGGTSNRYETLDIKGEKVPLPQVSPTATYHQTRFKRRLLRTEEEAVFHYNFKEPKYHIVHNNKKKTKFGVPRAFRLHIGGMSKQLIPEGVDNQVTTPWTQHQLAVTVQKDEELISSSPYALFDSYDPVTNFDNFISDESIVDQDLVFWIPMGIHHIPHTEDIPVTPTPGGHLSFFILPYNYFSECPSMSSRDAIRVEYVTPDNPADGLRVERNGNQANEVCGAKTLEQLVEENPGAFLET